jgi:tetratricopeptide (TPR) repeat protein
MMTQKLKVGVYAIIKDERHLIERFLKSAVEADYLVVTDTGSSDGTWEFLQELEKNQPYPGCKIIVARQFVRPWRFDVPRNVALHMLPTDTTIAVSFDIDEVFTDGWAEHLRDNWNPETRRGRYFYSWSHNPDGSPATSFWYDKIHTRHGFRWVKPVHEILQFLENHEKNPEIQQSFSGFQLHHWPDVSKSRSQYLPLLEQSVREEPNDDRNSHYLGREYMYYGKHEKAIAELKRHLSLESARWNEERAASMRFIGRSYAALGDFESALEWFEKATTEAPGSREPWFELLRHCYVKKEWSKGFWAGVRGLSIIERPKSYICEPDAWSYLMEDYTAICAYRTDRKREALVYGRQAVEKAKESGVSGPMFDRLVENLKWYTGETK